MARDPDLISLRSVTPDGAIKSKDAIFVQSCTSMYGYVIKEGIYFLDTYDVLDGTCFIAVKNHHIPKQAHNKSSFFCYAVPFEVISSLEAKFGEMAKKAREDLDEVAMLNIIKQLPQCEYKVNLFKTLGTIQKKLKKK